MPRSPAYTVANAPENSREIAVKLEKKVGKLLNIHAGMARAPAVIGAHNGISETIAAHGTFDARSRETIALAVGNENGCDYCQAAHTLSGRQAGQSMEQSTAIRAGAVDFDQKLSALTQLVREAAVHTGTVTDDTWQEANCTKPSSRSPMTTSSTVSAGNSPGQQSAEWAGRVPVGSLRLPPSRGGAGGHPRSHGASRAGLSRAGRDRRRRASAGAAR